MNDKQFNKYLGCALLHFRTQQHLTQQQVADKMGITKMAVSNYEKGNRQIFAQVWKDYCEAIGVSMQTVLNYIDENYNK